MFNGGSNKDKTKCKTYRTLPSRQSADLVKKHVKVNKHEYSLI